MKVAGLLFVALLVAAALALIWVGWKVGLSLSILSVAALMAGAVLDERRPKP
ncbi:hypothetical protein [Rhodococcus pyridinivorans]|uniref:Uncharacterized protein n=1 Tax=Rhodococcus pyridinivorans TaxID=103816 RepID=A0A7M2XNX5_9NOCA|nr:hypothetical protein [Rhodococcus pyridinivorans]QOV99524.1 hypothetical protein INP59_03735 [Rhodococcus pyridinivorans]